METRPHRLEKRVSTNVPYRNSIEAEQSLPSASRKARPCACTWAGQAYFGGMLKQGLAYAQAADPTSEAGLQLSTSLELYHHRGWAKKAVDSSDLARQ